MAKAPPAKENTKEDVAEGEELPPKKKGKLPLLIGLLVVLIVAGGAGWYFFSKKSAVTEEPVKVVKPKPPVFVPLDPFTVNLAASAQGEQYLQVAATLKVLDPPSADALKQYMPEMRHRILTLLASKNPAELASGEGRERLAEEMRQTANNILLAANGNPVKPIRLDVPITADSGSAEEAPAAAAAAAASDKEDAQAPAPGSDAEEKPAAPAAPAQQNSEAAVAAQGAAGKPAASATAAAKPAPATRLARASEDDPVQNVFFTSFIIQ